MGDLVTIALSGVRFSISSFGRAASNIASVNSGGPAPAAAPNPPAPLGTVSGVPGVAPALAPTVPAYGSARDPSSPPANGEAAPPNVDLAEEMVKIAMAVQAFRANIAVMNAANQMTKATLDILS